MAIELNNALFSSISKGTNVGDSNATAGLGATDDTSSSQSNRSLSGMENPLQAVDKKPVVESRKQEADEKSVEKAIEDINANSKLRMRNLELSINDELNRTVIKVIDSETGELIRQIPSEKVLQLAEKLKESGEPNDAVVSGLLLEDES